MPTFTETSIPTSWPAGADSTGAGSASGDTAFTLTLLRRMRPLRVGCKIDRNRVVAVSRSASAKTGTFMVLLDFFIVNVGSALGVAVIGVAFFGALHGGFVHGVPALPGAAGAQVPVSELSPARTTP
jgi:hypothetical protein